MKLVEITSIWGPEDDIQGEARWTKTGEMLTDEEWEEFITNNHEEVYDFWYQAQIAKVDFLD